MIPLQGKHNTAKVFTYNVEQEAISQIINLLNQPFVAGSQIRIMPDVHAGAGCTIGTTMTITDKAVPNLVGVDIGCGMRTAILKEKDIDLEKLDKVIHKNVPAGFSVRQTEHRYARGAELENLRCVEHVNLDRAYASIGTLGGGNHFIEVGRAESGALALIIHTGSRNLGKQIAEHYQKIAIEQCEAVLGRKMSKQEGELAFLSGQAFDDYLHDMNIAQEYAIRNRWAIIDSIDVGMRFETPYSVFETVHNYIDMESKILRKGAISAKEDEHCLIPLNMRDGSLLCVGKGNDDWNQSAPHGAGRIMSRGQAKREINLDDFTATMEGIYSTTVNKTTLDEAPMAYKPMQDIIDNIGDTVDIVNHFKPIYNFKSAGN